MSCDLHRYGCIEVMKADGKPYADSQWAIYLYARGWAQSDDPQLHRLRVCRNAVGVAAKQLKRRCRVVQWDASTPEKIVRPMA